MEPSRIYVNEVLPFIKNGSVKALVHITSGLVSDVQRIIPNGYEVCLDFGALAIPEVYGWLTAKFSLSSETLVRNFNCGVGMVLILPKSNREWRAALRGAKVIGVLKRCQAKNCTLPSVVVRNFKETLAGVAKKFNATKGKDNLFNFGSDHKLQERPSDMSQRLTTVPKKFKDPILVLGTDGVGTKIKIAQEMEKNSTVGIDLVAMCVNDILCNGAEPCTFSSYYACGKIHNNIVQDIIKGVTNGSQLAGCRLVGKWEKYNMLFVCFILLGFYEVHLL